MQNENNYMDHSVSVNTNNLSSMKLPIDVKISQDSNLDKVNVFDTTSHGHLTSLNDIDGSPILIHNDTETINSIAQRNSSSKILHFLSLLY